MDKKLILIILIILLVKNFLYPDALALKSKIKYISLEMDKQERQFDIEDKVKYYDEVEKIKCLVLIKDGLFFNIFGEKIDTTNRLFIFNHQKYYLSSVKFVMDIFGNIFLKSVENITNIKHSQYLSGGPVADAGLIEIRDGKLVSLDTDSGHYKPSNLHVLQMVDCLIANGIIDFQVNHLYKPFFGKNITLIIAEYLEFRYSAAKKLNQYNAKYFKFIYICA